MDITVSFSFNSLTYISADFQEFYINKKLSFSLKKIEKPVDGKWITSGTLGSRDAVLVFRTNILSASSRGSTTGLHKTSTTSLSAKKDEPPQQHQQQPLTTAKVVPDTSNKKSANANNDKSNSNNITLHSIFTIHKTKVNPKSEPYGLDKLLNESTSSSNDSISSDVGHFVVPTKYDLVRNVINIVEKSSDDDEEEEEDAEVENENEPLKTNCDTKCSNLVSNEFNNDSIDFTDSEETRNDDSLEVLEPHSPDMPALKLKLSYKFMQTETKLLRQIFVRHGLTEVQPDENFTILWTGIHMKPDILRNLAPYQRVNHFPR